jgi:hypothetical protein
MFIFVIEAENTIYRVSDSPTKDIHDSLGYWINIGDVRPIPEPGWKYINGELIPADLTSIKNTIKQFINEKWILEIKRTATSEQQYQYEKAIADINSARTLKQLVAVNYDYKLSAKFRPKNSNVNIVNNSIESLAPNGQLFPPQELR